MNNSIHNLINQKRTLIKNGPVAFDGVVDEESYAKSKRKIAFLLKEVNDPDRDTDWEFIHWLFTDIKDKSKKLYKTWPNVCLWMELLKDVNTNYIDCLTEDGAFDDLRLRENLLDIAVVNIKKTPGGGSSLDDELIEAIDSYGQEITRPEIEELLKPDVVFCGGTFYYALRLYKNPKVSTFNNGTKYFKYEDIIFVESPHPMWYQVDRKILFAYMKSIIEELNKMQ